MRKGSTSLGRLGTVFPAAAAGLVLLILPVTPFRQALPAGGPAAWAAEMETTPAERKDGPAPSAGVDERAARESLLPLTGPPAPASTSGAGKSPAAARKPAVLKVIHTRATWYGPGFHGRRTASGERFNQHAMTLASRHLAFGTLVRVVNPRTGKSAVGRVNDRGPFRGGYTADLSRGMAQRIGMRNSGPVRLEILAKKKAETKPAKK